MMSEFTDFIQEVASVSLRDIAGVDRARALEIIRSPVFLLLSLVAVAPLANFNPAYRVTLNVQRFESVQDQAVVIEAVLGTDEISEVALTSPFAPGVTHRFTNLRAYTEEVANARIYAGFHYRSSTIVGREMGQNIGDWVVKSVMQPAQAAMAQ